MKQLNSISRNTLLIGLLLMLVGILGRVLSGTMSITALIPFFFGLPIAVLGWLSRNPTRARQMQWISFGLAVLGILGTYRVVSDAFTAEEFSFTLASRGLMFILCIALLILSGLWLLQSRRA